MRGLTLADSVPSLHCGLPADFLNCSCAIDNVLTCFSLSVNILHYRLHFLPYCIEKEKRLGLLLHILSFYTFIFLEWWDSELDSQDYTGLLLRDFKLCIFNTTVKLFKISLVFLVWGTIFCHVGINCFVKGKVTVFQCLCWYKLSYYFARVGLATERIQYCKGNSLISLDNKLMFYQVLYFYFCWLISEFVVQAGNSEVTEV